MRTAFSILSFVFLALLAKSQPAITAVTDSSIIYTGWLNNTKYVEERIKGKNLIYYTSYYKGSNTVFETSTLDTLGNYIEILTRYDKKGKIIYTVNYELDTWTVYNKKLYPNLELLNNIKKKADSLVISFYSELFFKQHVSWDFDESTFYNDKHKGDGDEGISWSKPVKWKPDKFILRYQIKMDDADLENNLIQLLLDSNGVFIQDEDSREFGFEKLPPNSPKNFIITYSNAREIAFTKGLIESDTAKASVFLTTEYIPGKTVYNRHYRIYVVQKYKSEKVDIKSSLTYSKMDHYFVWVFNPWTGDFMGQKKMYTSTHYSQGYPQRSSSFINDGEVE